jgi:hypothetical protein
MLRCFTSLPLGNVILSKLNPCSYSLIKLASSSRDGNQIYLRLQLGRGKITLASAGPDSVPKSCHL